MEIVALELLGKYTCTNLYINNYQCAICFLTLNFFFLVTTIDDASLLQSISEELAMSCLICLELQTIRNKSYDYVSTNLAAILNSKHKGGYMLQYTHSRIVRYCFMNLLKL